MSRFNINDMIDDIVEEQRKKVKNAVKKAEGFAKRRIEEIIPEKMVDTYYGEYDPRHYTRTRQLEKSVGPYAVVKESGNNLSLQIGVEDDSPFGPGAMNHVKRGKSKSKIKPDENIIFENFLEGVHPNAGGIGNDFQGTNIEENVLDALDDLLENEIMPMIEREVN